MSVLTKKAKGVKTVTSATETKANATPKKENLKPILESKAERRLKNFDVFSSFV